MEVPKFHAEHRHKPSLANVGALFGFTEQAKNVSGTARRKESMEIQKSVTLVTIEELDTFEPEHFDATKFVEAKCATVGEKALKRLCGELREHSRLSLEEMRKDVYKHYAAFIRTSKEISLLDLQLQQMKHLLAAQAALITGLEEQSQQTVLSAIQLEEEEDEEDEEGGGEARGKDLWEEEPEVLQVSLLARAIPERLDILLAECKVSEAIRLIEEGEDIVARSCSQGESEEGLREKEREELARNLVERREKLQEQLVEATRQATVSVEELRAAVGALHRLGGSQRAHSLLLNAYKNKVRSQARHLKHSGASYGGAYTVALSQLVFSSIWQAARDSGAVWEDEPEYASELVLWAQKETEWCASLLKLHVLSSSGSAGGLMAAAECVTIALGHCSLLEEQGLSLTPVLSKLMRPVVEEALQAHIYRIEESVAALAAGDSWKLLPLPAGSRLGKGGSLDASNLLLSNSAMRLYTLLQEFVEDLGPVVSLQLMGPALDRMAHLFERYIGLLIRALPATGQEEERAWDGPAMPVAYEERKQLVLLANVTLLADELLPRLATRLAKASDLDSGRQAGSGGRSAAKKRDAQARRSNSRNLNEQKEWRRRLQKAVDKLRDILCSCLVEDFIYGDDGQPLLTADEYLQMDAQMGTEEWRMSPMPSPPFQALFVALNAIAGTASEVLEDREKVITMLLMRLAEWLVMGLMEYSHFWEQLEESEYALGPVGLQQLVLDMYFVMQVAANGKFSSRAIRKAALDSMAKGITMYKEQTGDDPNRVLEKDQWFQARCQEAIKLLLETHPAIQLYTEDEGPYSPGDSEYELDGEEEEEYDEDETYH